MGEIPVGNLLNRKLAAQSFRNGTIAFFVYRFLVTITIGMAAYFLPPQKYLADPFYELINPTLGTSIFSRLLVQPWFRWDTVHYVGLAVNGYQADLHNTVWPPLYPVLIELIDSVFHNPTLSALIVANLAAWVFFILLFGYAARFWGDKVARDALLWCAVFPTAFFLTAGYTESVYLVLSLACMWAAREHKWWAAGLTGALAVATRTQGIVLCLPIFIWMLEDYLKTRRFNLVTAGKQVLAMACLPAAFGLHALYVRFGMQTLWPWEALREEWQISAGPPWVGLWGNITSFTTRAYMFDYAVAARVADTILPIVAIVILIMIAKKIPRAELAYAAALVLMFLSKMTADILTTSVARYLMSVYILFVGLALLVNNKYLKMALFFVFALSQVLLIAVFEMWGWVG